MAVDLVGVNPVGPTGCLARFRAGGARPRFCRVPAGAARHAGAARWRRGTGALAVALHSRLPLAAIGPAVLVALIAVLAFAPTPAAAQVGHGTDIITGVVTGTEGVVLQDATVEAYSLETQITRRVRTDARGRYTILFPDGGGQYRMMARRMGHAPRTVLLVRNADEDRLVWNVRLAEGAVALQAVTVRSGPAVRPGQDAPAPGSSERAFDPDDLARMPLDATDRSVLASLSPGVLLISSTDSTAAAFSVAGLGADANALTLDGLLFRTATVPLEGLRQTRVVTSTYDASRGQFSGGLVASTTRGGGNFMAGSSMYQLRDADLSVNSGDSPYTQGFTQNVLSGGLGGPLVRDRVFVFGSLQARLRSDPQQTLLSAGATDFGRLGVSPDSVARFLGIVDALGVPHASVPGAATSASNSLSGLLRLDAVISSAHSLTLRADWGASGQEPARLGPLALPQTGGEMTGSGGGVMGTFTSRFGSTVLNELRGYHQSSTSDGHPYSRLPQGRVQVASDLADSARGVTTLVFGGNTGMPSRSHSSRFEVSDEVSWLPGGGSHRIKLGASFLTESSRNTVGGNLLGTYTYNSLADLAVGRPATFRRTLEVPERRSDASSWSLFAGDVWMVSRPLQLAYGVRLEGSSFRNPPQYNPAVDSVFGRRTDLLPAERHLSPRIGFTWTLGALRASGGGELGGSGSGMSATVIRGGVGEFRSQPPTGLVSQARSATGLAQSAAEIVCVGAGVPMPRWDRYWLDPDSIPAECASGGTPSAGGFQSAHMVTLLAPGFEAPRAWRGSLGVERRLTPILRITVDASLARGVAQTGYTDLNLRAVPRFTLASEGSRPVFVEPGDIATATGAPRFAASRVDSAFGSALEARSNLRSSSLQFTAGLGGIVGRGIVFQASYTWQRVRNQQSGARGNTAGDPVVVEWGRSEQERRHSFLLTLTYPVGRWIEITSIGRLSSGTPYTPAVGGDVNGDGMRNDRAFVFIPSSEATASAEARGMAHLLSQASPAVRSCLEGQVGRVAARGSCTGPWQGTLDFQTNWRPTMLGLNGRLTVSVITSNFLRGVDELLHGTAGAKGWGIETHPDNTLLYVAGFDSATLRYDYEVNGRFGASGGSATAFRPPFQIVVQARLQIGPDRQRAAMDAMRGGGPGMMRDAQFTPAQMIARIDSALPNPAGAVIALRDSLGLDSGQVVLLRMLRDSLTERNAVRVDSLRRTLDRGGGEVQIMRLMPAMRPLFQAARDDVSRVLVSVRAILTDEQWAKVPESLKNIREGLRRGRSGGPGGPPPA